MLSYCWQESFKARINLKIRNFIAHIAIVHSFILSFLGSVGNIYSMLIATIISFSLILSIEIVIEKLEALFYNKIE